MGRKPELIKDDGTLWRASYGDAGEAMACLFDAAIPSFFLRQVGPNPARKWWTPWRPKQIDTGMVWKGHELKDGGFRLISKEPK